MGWWPRLRGWAQRTLEQTFLTNPAQWLVEMFGGGRSATGVTVTADTAIQSVPVYAAVRNIAEDVAKLPLKVYRHLAAGGKAPDPTHPLYTLLHDSPNPEQTSIEFREWLVGNAILRGNGYAEIVRSRENDVVQALWPLPPGVRPERLPDGRLVYWIPVPDRLARQTGRREEPLPAAKVLHLRGLSFDSVLGYSPMLAGREAIGLSLAAEEYGARFFGSGAHAGGVIKTPNVFDGPKGDAALKRFKANWEQAHQGLSQAHRVAILEGGMEWQPTTVENEHAQFNQTRLYQMREIFRLLRLPPHKGGDMERATFSNIEQQALEYVTDTLMSWLVRIEQRLGLSLLSARERHTHFVKHVVQGLLRGDVAARGAWYNLMLQNGVFSIDEVRELEDMNPLPDGQGQGHFHQLNMTEVGSLPPAPAAPAPDSATEPEADDADTARRLSLFVGDIAARVLRAEVNETTRAATKYAGDGAAWRAWCDEFYPRHTAYIAERLRIPVDVARIYTEDHRAQLLAHGITAAESWNGEATADLVALTLGRRSGGR